MFFPFQTRQSDNCFNFPKRPQSYSGHPGLTLLRLSLRDGGSLHRYPGTPCLATISLSLRDKSHSPIEGLRIKLALMGLKPWAESYSPCGAKKHPKRPFFSCHTQQSLTCCTSSRR